MSADLAFIAPEGSPPPPAPSTPAVPRFTARLQHGPLAPALAFVAGLAAALGFAPIGIFAFTLFGLAALVVLCEAAPRRARVLGWLWGIGHFAFGTRWIAEAFTYQDKMPHWLGWPVVLGLAALLATMPLIACWLTWRVFPRHRTGGTPGRAAARGGFGTVAPEVGTERARALARLWVFPAAWIATEWLRGHLFTGFPWNPLAASTLDVPGLAQPAALIGALGLSGVIALIAAAIGFNRWRVAVVAALTLVVVALARVGWIDAYAPGAQPIIELVIVQPNISQADKWNPAQQARNLDTLMRLSRSVPAPTPGHPRVILWPEVALADAEAERDPALRAQLATLLRPGDYLITGGLAVDWNAAGQPVTAHNRVFVIDSAGAIRGRHDKSHLVPGGEYVPLRPLADALGLSRLAPGDIDFTPGPGARTVDLPGLDAPVGPLVCYEMIFAHAIVDEAHRPRWLFNPSNDGWFADTGPWQHLALARLRAIEEGLPIARSTPTGVSALIGAAGELLAIVPPKTPGALLRPLPRELAMPLSARGGDLIPLALALLALAVAWRTTRQRT